MWTNLTYLLLAAIVNVNSLVNSSKTLNANEDVINCKELRTIVGDFDFNCPVVDGNVRINKNKTVLLIECIEPAKFQFAIFPKLNLYEVNDIKLQRCTFEENINFGSLLEHFGINNTQTFEMSDMKGLLHLLPLSEGFERLENLKLRDNVIKDLDENVFQGLEKLRTLRLSGNKITDLPKNIFASLTNLQSLVLSNNKIEIIYDALFMHQKEIERLYLNGNEISNLPEDIFLNLAKLEDLDLHQNLISYFPENIFANLTNLEDLMLSKNKIKVLHERLFTHQKKLEGLYLDGNEISNLPEKIFANLKNLQYLTLSNNTIKVLHEGLFTHQEKLERLYLDGNKISNLPENIFANLTNLRYVRLSNNKIQILHEKLFMHQKQLVSLYLDSNEILDLSKNVFAKLTNLQYLNLSKNQIETLREGLFTHQLYVKYLRWENYEITKSGKYMLFLDLTNLMLDHFSGHPSFSGNLHTLRNHDWPNMSLRRVKISNGIVFPSNLEIIKIQECEFEYNVTFDNELLPFGKRVNSPSALIFANQKKLQRLYLTQNELTDLDDKLFKGLNELHLLDLSYNNLTSISGFIFRELRNMSILSLEHNHIKSIHSDAFEYTTKLMALDLSYNQLQYFDTKSFMYHDKFLSLNLSNNYLTTLPSGWKDVHTLRWLDLGFNHISSYKHNDVHNTKSKIYYKEYYQLSRDEFLDGYVKNEGFLSMFLNNNSLSCDCIMYRFLLVRKTGLINEFVNLLSEICGGHCNETIVSSSQDCPARCKCKTNLENNVEIRCENEWISEHSLFLEHLISNKSIELYINKNSYTELPNLHNNELVITIQASYNRIKELKLENIPPNLRFLDVSHNHIKTISADVIDALHKKLEAFLIVDTPWECECSANTDKFIQLFTEIVSITDFQETNCHLPSGDIKLSNLRDHCATQTHNTFLIVLAVLLVIIVSLVCLLVILFYKYKKITKIWLYTHNICLCCIGEDEFDKDKKFDAFISYSFHDEDVAVNILNELENGDPRFKICIHQRDFVPGRLIHNSIAECMDDSCRTIVILSKNFLRSVWGQHEFRRAYETGLAERRMRLIIVIIGDIGNIEPPIKSYLKTHTYIKWGDPWFWQKMRYALPHRNRNTRLSQSRMVSNINMQSFVK